MVVDGQTSAILTNSKLYDKELNDERGSQIYRTPLKHLLILVKKLQIRTNSFGRIRQKQLILLTPMWATPCRPHETSLYLYKAKY